MDSFVYWLLIGVSSTHTQAGIRSLETDGVLEKLRSGLDAKADQPTKEAASHLFGALAKTVGTHAEPYLVSVLPALLDLCGDKLAPVRAAAEPAAVELSNIMNPHAMKKVRLLQNTTSRSGLLPAACIHDLRPEQAVFDETVRALRRFSPFCTMPWRPPRPGSRRRLP